MTIRTTQTPPLAYARIAGLLYLLIIVFGVFSEAVIRSNLIVKGDAAATAANILANQALFRAGFAADIIMLLSDVAIAVLFYVLLKPVSRVLAMTAAAFRLTQAAVLGFNLLNYYSSLLLLNGSEYTSAFGTRQSNALAMLFLDMHSHGYDLGLIFFALSSLILGYLVIRSGYFPGLLGYGLMAAAAVYLVGSCMRFLLPAYASYIAPVYIVPLIAELAFCLWLLVKGIRFQPNESGPLLPS